MYKDSKYLDVAPYRAEATRRDERELAGTVVAGNSRDIRYLEPTRKYEEKRKDHERYADKELRYLQVGPYFIYKLLRHLAT